MGQKPNKKEKDYNALNVHIVPPEMNNLMYHQLKDFDTYANQSLYINLVNNFVRFRVNV